MNIRAIMTNKENKLIKWCTKQAHHLADFNIDKGLETSFQKKGEGQTYLW